MAKKQPAITPEANQAPFAAKSALSFWPLFFKAAGLSLVFAILMLTMTALGVGVWGYGQFQQFLSSAGLSQAEFIEPVKSGWNQRPTVTEGHKNMLVLGVDNTAERGEVPALTDTMMLASINTESGVINTLPLPRDLWNQDYQTKINALYAYGLDRYPEKPEQFATEVLGEMTGVTIHHTFVLSLEQLQELVDLVGGVTIEVKQGFTDPLYPREGVDITSETDPAVLYETVSFEAGQQELNGKQALQYIRSRHSEDEQGHDLARGARQQQVIEALMAKLTNYKLLVTQPKLAGKLYRFYEENFSQELPLTEIVSTGRALIPHRRTLAFQSHQLTTTEDSSQGVLDNPPRLAAYQYQWVYVIGDQQEFAKIIQEKLFAE
jgi:LCP family protein required for cell wall assembly